MSRALARTPNAFFKSYISSGKVDLGWKDKREGRFFNQIDLSGLEPDSPDLFLASLIHTQIDAYPASRSPNPLFFGKNTADKYDLDKLLSGLQNVCTLFKSRVGTIKLPTQSDKLAQGFTGLTTQKLLSLSTEKLLVN